MTVENETHLFRVLDLMQRADAPADALRSTLLSVVQGKQVLERLAARRYADVASRSLQEVAPLRELSQQTWKEASRGRMPQYAVIPSLSQQRLVADLDRVMTVEKPVVTGWEQVQGCTTDAEARQFASALARKRARVAFPDDFVEIVRPLEHKLREKHDKQSIERNALRALREVRVAASPSWDADAVEVTFYFLRKEGALMPGGKPWAEWADAWLAMLDDPGRYDAGGMVATLKDLTAQDYVESDPLDLGYLSERTLVPRTSAVHA